MKVMHHREAPIISVIVPIYNTGLFLEDCISSVLNQSFSNFELILVNDGSTDNSKAICDRMCEEDGRIRLISYKDNRGVSYARNKGIDSAIGKYLFFLDSDDMIHPRLLEEELRQAEATGADMMMIERFYSDRNTPAAWENFCGSPLALEWQTFTGEELWRNWFKFKSRNCIGGKLFLKDAVSDLRFDEMVGCFEDGLFNYTFLGSKPRTILYTTAPCYFYRIRSESSWHSMQLEELLQTLNIRHRIMDREREAGREYNAAREEEGCIQIIRNWYARNEKSDKRGAAEIKKLVKEEKSNVSYQQISGREKRLLFLSMNFPSLYSSLMSARKR